MFIKIVYEDIDETSVVPFESTIECRKYSLRRNEARQLIIDMDNGEHIYVIERDCSVFVMNKDGRTTDRII